MMTFKEYLLREDDAGDEYHDEVWDARAAFIKHCSQWDVTKPLYRISNPTGDEGHRMRTRSPRTRSTDSRGGSAGMQKYLFNLPSWSEIPSRTRSIFCSTVPDFEVGEIEDGNLQMIYPFDGTTMAITSTTDFNFNRVFLSLPVGPNLKRVEYSDFWDWISEVYYAATKDHPFDITSAVENLQKYFTGPNGKVDPEANGDADYAERYKDMMNDHERENLRIVIEEIPECLSPKNQGIRLVTPESIDLPGRQREVWFSGKYLNVPAKYHEAFVDEVKAYRENQK